MELYKELAALRCFTHDDMVRIMGSESAAQWQIRKYLQKGYIERIRRGLYAVISMETGQPIPSRFQIASRVSDDAYVSHHSAFEFYGYANQVFYDVYFATEKKVRSFDYDGMHYQSVGCRGNAGVEELNTGVRVATIERTVIDSIADFTKIAGLEEVLRCLALIPSLDEERLLESLELYGQGQLFQKVGYVLEAYKNELSLSDTFFDRCADNSSVSKMYLFDKQDDFVFHKKWQLYAPKELRKLIDKGASYYDAV